MKVTPLQFFIKVYYKGFKFILGPTYFDLFNTWYKIKRTDLFGPDKNTYNKPIFIHVPKAAGVSVIEAGANSVFGHKQMFFYEYWKPYSVKMPLTYAIVRHPVDRFVSAYEYLKSGRGNQYDQYWVRRRMKTSETINDFIFLIEKNTTILKWMHFIPQTKFVTNKKGEITVDYIFKYEELNKVWPQIVELAHLDKKLPQRNINYQKKNEKIEKSALNVLYKVYREDFDNFHYKMVF